MNFVYEDAITFKCKLDSSLPMRKWQEKYDELQNWYSNLFEDHLFKCEIRRDSYEFYIYLCVEKRIAELLESYLDLHDYNYAKQDSCVLQIICDTDEFKKEFNDIDIEFIPNYDEKELESM